MVFGNGKKIEEQLNPGMERHCDLGFILHPQRKQIVELLDNSKLQIPFNKDNNILFIISFVVKPKIIQSYILVPGSYKIQLVCLSSNSKMISDSFDLVLNDKWNDDYEEMLSNIVIKKYV